MTKEIHKKNWNAGQHLNTLNVKVFLLFLQIFYCRNKHIGSFQSPTQQVQLWSISHGFSHTANPRLLSTQSYAAMLLWFHTAWGQFSSENFKSIRNEHPRFAEIHPGFAPHHLQLNSLPSAWISSPPSFSSPFLCTHFCLWSPALIWAAKHWP